MEAPAAAIKKAEMKKKKPTLARRLG